MDVTVGALMPHFAESYSIWRPLYQPARHMRHPAAGLLTTAIRLSSGGPKRHQANSSAIRRLDFSLRRFDCHLAARDVIRTA